MENRINNFPGFDMTLRENKAACRRDVKIISTQRLIQ